tara:strand:- start:636 stop:1289 length:654 start_codon:yes stop_codon:yes gene_type:complete
MNSAILFDMDGVVLDTEPLYTNAQTKLFKEYGISIPKEDWGLFCGCSEEEFYTLSMKKYNITESRSIFIKKGQNYIREEFTNNLCFMPGFYQLINRIKNKHKIGLVTASPKHMLNWLLKRIELDSFFNYIISGEDAKRNKPFPDPYLMMMRNLNVKPSNCIIIEDSAPGIKAAIDSGAYVIAKTGSTPLLKLKKAHYIVNHLDEITNLLINNLLNNK